MYVFSRDVIYLNVHSHLQYSYAKITETLCPGKKTQSLLKADRCHERNTCNIDLEKRVVFLLSVYRLLVRVQYRKIEKVNVHTHTHTHTQLSITSHTTHITESSFSIWNTPISQ